MGLAAPRGLGHLCKASLTAVPLTPKWHPLQRNLIHHLEPGSSWEGDETLVRDGAKSTPWHVPGPFRPMCRMGRPSLVQGLPGTLWECAKEAEESIWHMLLPEG